MPVMACGVLHSLKFKFGQLLLDDPSSLSILLVSLFDTFKYPGDVAHFRCFRPCLGLLIHVQLQLSGTLFPPRSSDPVSHEAHDDQPCGYDRLVTSDKLRMRGILLRCAPCKHWQNKLIAQFSIGCYTVLFTVSTYLMFHRPRRGSGINKPIFFISGLLYLLCSTHFALVSNDFYQTFVRATLS